MPSNNTKDFTEILSKLTSPNIQHMAITYRIEEQLIVNLHIIDGVLAGEVVTLTYSIDPPKDTKE